MALKITPFLWFDSQAEEAANFYVSLFDDAEITAVNRYGEDMTGTPGTVMVVGFRLGDTEFTALNGGPHYQLSPATSFMIHCKNQEEVDHFWNAFSDGGEPMACGWVTDRFGVTWQVTPDRLLELMGDSDPAKAARVTQAMLQMGKIEIADLEAAASAG